MSPLLTGRLARLKEKLPLSGHQTPEDKLIPADAEFSSELQEAEQLTVAKKNLVPEKYRAIVENVVYNGLLGIAEDKLNDDEFINNLFNKVYEILPIYGKNKTLKKRVDMYYHAFKKNRGDSL